MQEVVLRIDKNPPVLGDNQVEVEIKDPSGKYVTDAEVLINYYMPPMPRMVPMNYKVDAKLKGEKYGAKMILIHVRALGDRDEDYPQGERDTR